jgi:VanZ family protein
VGTLAAIVLLALGVLSLRAMRWAYLAYVVFAVAWIPARTGFRLHAPPCETTLTLANSALALTKVWHVGLFGLFFVMTAVQFTRRNGAALVLAGVATMVMGMIIEVEEGATGTGHCRVRDLLPDTAGAVLGAMVLLALGKARIALAARRRSVSDAGPIDGAT